jgi:hypothetical protein
MVPLPLALAPSRLRQQLRATGTLEALALRYYPIPPRKPMCSAPTFLCHPGMR